MPLDRIVKAGKAIYDDGMARKSAPKKMVSDPEIPVPGRQRGAPQPTNQSKANAAADMLRVPGRDVVRGAMQKRKKMLDDL